MLNGKPPFKIIVPKELTVVTVIRPMPLCFINWGLHIDQDITMGHLKGCLDYFIKEFLKLKM